MSTKHLGNPVHNSWKRYGRIAIVGGAGGIGQPLGLLAAQVPGVARVNLIDVEERALGAAADIGHCDFNSVTKGFAGTDYEGCLTDSDIVLVPAGVPRKPGMTRDDLFNSNATIAANIAQQIAKYCPLATIGVICNPVNSTVPIMAEVLKKNGVFDARKLMGVTTLDIVRANKFVGTLKGIDANRLDVTVVGGHSGPTIVPVLSGLQGSDGLTFTDSELETLVQRIQYGGDEVVQAKAGAGSATLSMAHAGVQWMKAVMEGQQDQAPRPICTFTQNNLVDGLEYFSARTQLGPQGVASMLPLPPMSAKEQALMEACKKDLAANIQKGIDFAATFNNKA